MQIHLLCNHFFSKKRTKKQLTKSLFSLLIAGIFFLPVISSYSQEGTDSLQEEFNNPPHPAKPWVYWINMDGHFTREGITADLEAMKKAGIGGMIHMDVDVGVPRGEVPFMSETWQKNFKHTIQECERLGLEFVTITGPGWTGTSGPWIDVENSMQHLVPVSVKTRGPAEFDQILPKPEPRVSPYHQNQTPNMQKELADFYEDVAVYAFPSCDPVIDDISEKALFIRNPFTSMPGVRPYLPSPANYPETDASMAIDPEKIIDLTGRLQKDGRLVWDVPAGEWTILRMGRRSTGANGRPAPLAGLGFESDKFSKEALESHFEGYFDPLLEKIGPRSKDRVTGFTGLDADSWEMSSQNWTPGFREAFQQRCGYDPWPYFPVYSGRVVGSREISERFLWDVRNVCQDLLLENHMAHMKQLCKERGLKLHIEPYDMNPTNDLNLGSFADVPMGEFWHNHFNSAWSCIEAASIGHVMGKPIVAAEAFTSVETYWKESPWTLKNQTDWAFAAGINRFVIVTFAHQPWQDKSPGMMFSNYGLHWERTQTFWPLVDDFHKYLARCSHMLQQGVTVSDILYLTPEGAPHVFRAPESALENGSGKLPDKKGYGFDGCSPKILMERAGVRDGLIAFPEGSSYRVMVLPRFETMTPRLLEEIMKLVKAGATVMGTPPLKSPSLVDYPACDQKIRDLVAELWGGLEAPATLTGRPYGSGKIYWGGPTSEGLYPAYEKTASLLKKMGIEEDFAGSPEIRYGHRQTPKYDIYFLSNKTQKTVKANCRFRTGKGHPELWDPVTGKTRLLPEYKQKNGMTSVPLKFVPNQSYFVMFPRTEPPNFPKAKKTNFPGTQPMIDFKGLWKVAFDTVRGGPGEVIFKQLHNWSKSEDPGICYYSGIATYRKSFVLPELPVKGTNLYLNLGKLHEMAHVRINGIDQGVVWCAPWQVDITGALKEGENKVEIAVANLWPNRLIGDAVLPAEERFSWTIVGHPYTRESKLLPSGLIGPVRLVVQEE